MKRLSRLFGAREDSTGGICSEKEFHQLLKLERSRTHRNGHEFSLVLFDLDEMQVSPKSTKKMIEIIRNRMRDTDQLGWYNKNKIGVVLPYTSAKGAEKFSETIMVAVQELKKQSKFTMITYPPEKKTVQEEKDESVLRSL